MIPKPLATAIIIVVTLVWAVNFGAQFIVHNYEPDVAINGIFMAIVGGALALSRRSGKSSKSDDDDEDADTDKTSAGGE